MIHFPVHRSPLRAKRWLYHCFRFGGHLLLYKNLLIINSATTRDYMIIILPSRQKMLTLVSWVNNKLFIITILLFDYVLEQSSPNPLSSLSLHSITNKKKIQRSKWWFFFFFITNNITIYVGNTHRLKCVWKCSPVIWWEWRKTRKRNREDYCTILFLNMKCRFFYSLLF